MSFKEFHLISIIIPVYKVEAYISDCIRSVINQSYKNFELILVDDAGEDKSIDIAKKLLLSSSINWKIITNSVNRGLSYSRNIGVKNARGRFLFFLDSDDYIDSDCLKNLYEKICETEADMVYGSIVYDVNGKVQLSPWIFTDLDTCSCQPLNLYIKQKAFVMACNRLIDRRFYDKCGICFKEGIVHEDEPWSFSLIIRAKKISFVKNVTYFYRRHSASITSQKLNYTHLDGLYYHLFNISSEINQFSLWKNKELQTWYAGQVSRFFYLVIFNSNITLLKKLNYIELVCCSIRIPDVIKEMDAYHGTQVLCQIVPLPFFLRLFFSIKCVVAWLCRIDRE